MDLDKTEVSKIKLPERLGAFLPWASGDGACRYHWASRPDGQKCGWSCVWITASGKVYPHDWGADPRTLTLIELCVELQDAAYTARDLGVRRKAGAYVEAYLDGSLTERESLDARGLLAVFVRPFYREFACFSNPPAEERGEVTRPGWPRPVYKIIEFDNKKE